MKRHLSTFTCMAIIFSLLPVSVTGDRAEGPSPEQLVLIKEQYDYGNWGDGSGEVISGLRISEKILPQLKSMEAAWQSDDYAVRKIQDHTFAEIRQWWRSESGLLYATMVVGPSFDAVKEYLIFQYTATSMVPPPVRPAGRQFAMEIGNLSFVTEEGKNAGSFSSIDFMRHNVLFMMRAEGSVQKDLRAMAEALDALLLKKMPVTRYDLHPDLPRIITFSTEKTRIRPGEKVPLNLEVHHTPQNKIHYDWTMTGGGVEKNFLGKYVYYGGEEGNQHITVRVVNELGLQDSASLNISVVP